MKRLALLAACLAATPVLAQVSATLTGFEEVPVVTTTASGTFTASMNSAGVISYSLSYSGLQGQVRQAHIHIAQKSVNGMIVLWLCGTTPTNPGPAGTPTCPQSGTVVGTLTAANVQTGGAQQIGDLDDVLAAIHAGAAYVNVHTDLSPGGEIRGQVR